MANRQRAKVVITGAAGQIGYALCFRVAAGEMLGPDVDIELQLLELPQALPSLDGVAMELDDCAFPLLKKIICTSELNVAMEGATHVLSVGAVPRKEGMERADLLKVNGGIFGPQGRAINDFADDTVTVLVVGNPCNTNCLIAMKNAPDVPNDQFFAMMTLDENRARTQLAKKAGVDVTEVSEMTIWGNHSATQYPDFYHAKIQGKSAATVINDDAWFKETFISTIQKRGAAVIKARGASSAASAANAAMGAIRHLHFDTPENESFSMARCSTGEYGVDAGLIFSFPCRRENGKLEVVSGIDFNEFSREKFDATLEELRQERDTVKGMGLID
jgi:malate dehydrogenase